MLRVCFLGRFVTPQELAKTIITICVQVRHMHLQQALSYHNNNLILSSYQSQQKEGVEGEEKVTVRGS